MSKLNRVSSKLVILSLVPLIIFSAIIFYGMKMTGDRYEQARNDLSSRLS